RRLGRHGERSGGTSHARRSKARRLQPSMNTYLSRCGRLIPLTRGRSVMRMQVAGELLEIEPQPLLAWTTTAATRWLRPTVAQSRATSRQKVKHRAAGKTTGGTIRGTAKYRATVGCRWRRLLRGVLGGNGTDPQPLLNSSAVNMRRH